MTTDNVLCTIKEDDVLYMLDGEEEFEREVALAVLLEANVIFLNNYWWKKSWPEDARKATALCVNCNDIFAWACADAEEIFVDELDSLYKMWLKDKTWGAALWCIQRRNLMPQKPVADAMIKAGYDLASMNLRPN